jgi:Family of unknown function (DUF6534)
MLRIINQILAIPTSFVYILFYFNIGRLYCNSLLATLNARNMIRSGSGPEEFSLSATTRVKAQQTFGGVVSNPIINKIKISDFANSDILSYRCQRKVGNKHR